MRCYKIIKVFILYRLNFKGHSLSKIKLITPVRLVKVMAIKSLLKKDLLLIEPSMRQSSEQSLSAALSCQRFVGDAA